MASPSISLSGVGQDKCLLTSTIINIYPQVTYTPYTLMGGATLQGHGMEYATLLKHVRRR